MSMQTKTSLTPQQYLEIERQAEFKSEYFAGEMFAMAGGSAPHILICSNLIFELKGQTRERRCLIYTSDMRVNVSAEGLYTYPDVSALCGEPKYLDERRDTLLNPSVIIEVLSASTEAYNRGRKFELYRAIESLAEYLLVSSDHMHADLFARQPDGRWILSSVGKPGDSLELASIGCRLVLADLYEKVDFE